MRRRGMRPASLPGGHPAGRVALAVLAVLLPAYLPLLGRGFASEDFLLIRFLRQEPPWSDLAALLLEPWLGIEVVRFWRPVSTVLLALEAHAFGGVSWPYEALHLLVHAGNATLLYLLARGLWARRPGEPHAVDEPDTPGAARWGGREGLAAAAAALLFALHPMAPNAVSWIASFATPFATCFLLAAFVAHLRFRRLGGRGWQAASLGLFALALGSYEAAVVLPILVAAAEHLRPAAAAERSTGARGFLRAHLRRALTWLPLALLAGLYLALRRTIFGVVVGGYEDFAQRLDPGHAARLLADLGEALVHLVVPWYGGPMPGWAPVALVALLLLGAVVLAADRRALRAWIFGWLWAVVALAPFAFAPFVPGNGRFAYLSAAGACLALGRLAAVPARRAPLRRAAAGGVLLLVWVWAALLVHYVGVYRLAGRTAWQVAGALAETPEAARGGTVFVAGYPVFLETAAGVPEAQVFHYGLEDSVRPPFRRTALTVYPLPPRGDDEWWPVAAGGPRAGLYTWDAAAGRLRPPAAPAVEPVRLAARALSPRTITFDPLTPDPVGVAPPGEPLRYRLLLAARGNPTVVDLGAAEGGRVRVPLPAEFLSTMERLYGGTTYWWVEGRDAAGALRAASPLAPVGDR
jgi:hypothetical protein